MVRGGDKRRVVYLPAFFLWPRGCWFSKVVSLVRSDTFGMREGPVCNVCFMVCFFVGRFFGATRTVCDMGLFQFCR